MSRASKLVTLFAAAGLGLGVATAATAQENNPESDAPNSVPFSEQMDELLRALEGAMTEEGEREVLSPEGMQVYNYIEVPEGMVVIPSHFEPTLRGVMTCTEAPAEDLNNGWYTVSSAMMLSVSESDLEAQGMTKEDFFATYGQSLHMVMQTIFNDVASKIDGDEVLGMSAEFVQAYNAASQETFANFEAATGITVRSDIAIMDKTPNGPACRGKPPRYSA